MRGARERGESILYLESEAAGGKGARLQAAVRQQLRGAGQDMGDHLELSLHSEPLSSRESCSAADGNGERKKKKSQQESTV